jgi:hypothetical protein
VIALSARHARWLVLLLGAALLPVLLEEVRPRRYDDCRHPDMLTLTLAIPGSKPTRSAARRTPAEPDGEAARGDFTLWTQGEIENPEDARNTLRFWMIRSFDPGAVSPRGVLDGAFDPESHEVRDVATEVGVLPVHVAIDRTRSPSRVVTWAWVYDGQPTAEIFPALLRAAPRRLLNGSVPVTLFLVDGAAHAPHTGAVDAAAMQWITEAWSHMARYCR